MIRFAFPLPKILAVAALAGLGATASAQPVAPDDSVWTALFNGRNLEDWLIKFKGRDLNENPENVVKVQEGILRIDQGDFPFSATSFGHLANQKRKFSHYLVRAEYMFVGKQGSGAPDWAFNNNGLMLHSQGMDEMGGSQEFPNSIEVQLLGDHNKQNNTAGTVGKGVTANLCTPGSHVYMDGKKHTQHCTTAEHSEIRDNEWVTVEVLVLGDSLIKHIVKGHEGRGDADTVIEYTRPTLDNGTPMKDGYIALQAESSTTLFRKLDVLDLAGCMNPQMANYKSYYVKDDPASCLEVVGIAGAKARGPAFGLAGRRLEIAEQENCTVEVLATDGTVLQRHAVKGPAVHDITVEKPGLYLVRVSAGNGATTRRLAVVD